MYQVQLNFHNIAIIIYTHTYDITITITITMLFQVRVVVMLTNLVEGCGFPSLKCALYWPDKVPPFYGLYDSSKISKIFNLKS